MSAMDSTAKSAANTMQQPAYGAPMAAKAGVVAGGPGPWTTGLCGCFEDASNCCVTCCCPCITFGRNAEIIDRGAISWGQAGVLYYCMAHIGLSSCYTCTYRTRLRTYFNLSEDPCNDFLVHFCCLTCAICQEYRELKNRGFDPSLGWMANADKWNKTATGTTMPPTFEAGMSR